MCLQYNTFNLGRWWRQEEQGRCKYFVYVVLLMYLGLLYLKCSNTPIYSIHNSYRTTMTTTITNIVQLFFPSVLSKERTTSGVIPLLPRRRTLIPVTKSTKKCVTTRAAARIAPRGSLNTMRLTALALVLITRRRRGWFSFVVPPMSKFKLEWWNLILWRFVISLGCDWDEE